MAEDRHWNTGGCSLTASCIHIVTCTRICMCTHTSIHIKLKLSLLCNLGMLLIRIYSGKIKSYFYTMTLRQMFMITSLLKAPKWKSLNAMLIH